MGFEVAHVAMSRFAFDGFGVVGKSLLELPGVRDNVVSLSAKDVTMFCG